MTLDEVYTGLNTVIKRERRGNSLTPDEFNSLIDLENGNFFKDKAKELQTVAATPEEFSELIYSSKLMRPLVIQRTVTPTTGVIDLSADIGGDTFGFWVSCVTTAVYNGMVRRIDLISHSEYERRLTNMLSPTLTQNPCARIDADNVRIVPTDIASVVFTYLKFPTQPVFDYYVDGNRNIQYLAVSATHTLTGSEIGSSGEVAPTEVTSNTIELAYGEEYHAEFFEYMLSRLGTRARDPIVYQSAETQQAKDKV